MGFSKQTSAQQRYDPLKIYFRSDGGCSWRGGLMLSAGNLPLPGEPLNIGSFSFNNSTPEARITTKACSVNVKYDHWTTAQTLVSQEPDDQLVENYEGLVLMLSVLMAQLLTEQDSCGSPCGQSFVSSLQNNIYIQIQFPRSHTISINNIVLCTKLHDNAFILHLYIFMPFYLR